MIPCSFKPQPTASSSYVTICFSDSTASASNTDYNYSFTSAYAPAYYAPSPGRPAKNTQFYPFKRAAPRILKPLVACPVFRPDYIRQQPRWSAKRWRSTT